METTAGLKTAILGFGNPVRSDDAIGVYVVNELQKSFDNAEDVSVFDMGTSAFETLFRLKGHDRIVIIDGVINSGENDGTIFFLPAKEIKSKIQEEPLLFLHGMKWDQALSYAKKMMGEDFPEEHIMVYLIAITETKINMEMSDAVKSAGDKVVAKIKAELS